MSSLEWDHTPQTGSQQTTALANAVERSETDAVEEVPATDDEGYCVYLLRLINYSDLLCIIWIVTFWCCRTF